MGWSVKIARVAGTEIKIHITFLIFPLWIGFVYYQEGGPRRRYKAWCSLVDYGAVPALPLARFHQPPFKPCLRFSRTRLNDDLLDVACVASSALRDQAFHQGVRLVVTTGARSCKVRTHLAHTHSRTAELSRFYIEVVGRFRHALTLTSSPT